MSARERSVMAEPMELTAELVAAYVSNNTVPKGDLPNLLLAVHSAISRLGTESPPAALPVEPQQPAVTIRKSITPDYLICLEDGKKFKSLRRHLAALGLTPEQYRKKWNLPSDYPMVAPKYSAERAALARQTRAGSEREGWRIRLQLQRVLNLNLAQDGPLFRLALELEQGKSRSTVGRRRSNIPDLLRPRSNA